MTLVRTAEKAVPSVRDRLARVKAQMKEMGEIKTRLPFEPLAVITSFISPQEQPWDEEGIKRIRVFDPGFVPIFRTKVYLNTATGAVLKFHHHGVCRHDRFSQPDPGVVNALRPVHGYFSRFPGGRHPNVMERWFENETLRVPGSLRAKYNLPAPFMAWGPWVERWVEETYWAASAKERHALYDETHNEESGSHIETHRAWEHEASEAAYAQQGEALYQKRLMDSMGVDDHREAVARQTGQWQEPARPFIDMGGAA